MAIQDLQKIGYTIDFNLHNDGLESKSHKIIYSAENLKVVKYYRFEGISNPEDSSILYVIETKDGKKGLLVGAYGAQSNNIPSEFLDKLKVNSATFK